MRRLIRALSLVLCAVLLTGCFIQRQREKYNLPEDPVKFEDRDSDSFDMRVLTVNGRDYMPFGTVKNRMDDSSIKACLGFLNGDRNTRVYTLEEDPDNNYIMIYNVEGIMEQQMYWRAADTMGKNVDTPPYIESLDYDEWASSGIYGERACVHLRLVFDADDMQSVKIEYLIDGKNAGEYTSGGPGQDMTNGSNHQYEIAVKDYCDRAFLGMEFPLAVKITVTDINNVDHVVDGGFDGTVKLEKTVSATLTGNCEKGYSLTKVAQR